QINPQVEPELEAICLKAMSKSIADRHASAAELAQALKHYLQTNVELSATVRLRTNDAPVSVPKNEPTLVLSPGSTIPDGSITQKSQEPPTARLTAAEVTIAKKRTPQTMVVAAAVLFILFGAVWWSTQHSPEPKSHKNKTDEQTLAGTKVSDDESSSQSVKRNSAPADILTSNDWEWTEPEKLPSPVNSGQADFLPSLSNDGLTLVFASRRDGGNGEVDLWQTTRAALDAPWQVPENLGPKINTWAVESAPCLSADGLTLFFDSPTQHPDAAGLDDIWFCTRPTTTDDWSEPKPMGREVNSPHREWGPCLSHDGRTLFFASDRLGSAGEMDLWMVARPTLEKPFGSPLGLSVNAIGREYQPKISSDDRVLLFVSNRAGSIGMLDLWMSVRADAQSSWSPPLNLGPRLNCRNQQVSGMSLSADGQTLIFSRALNSKDELWQSRRVPKQKAVTASPARDVADLDETPMELRLIDNNYEWSAPINLGEVVNSKSAEEHPYVGHAGRTLVFVRNDEIWLSTRAGVDQPFGPPERLPKPVNKGHRNHSPFLSADGLTLIVGSTRPGSKGESDLWMFRRTATDKRFEGPLEIGTDINTPLEDSSACFSSDGLSLWFATSRATNRVNAPMDLWTATRSRLDEPFRDPKPLPGPANQPLQFDFFPRLVGDGRALLFTTTALDRTNHVMLCSRPDVQSDFSSPAELFPGLSLGQIGAVTVVDRSTLIFDSLGLGGHGGADLWMIRRLKKSPPQPLIAESYELQFMPATFVEVESLKLDPTGPHTQEAWVTPGVSEIKRPIHVFGQPQGSSLFLDDTSGGWGFGLVLDDGFRHVASKPIERDQRSHVAVVRANREMRLFVNGKLASRRDESGLPLLSPSKRFLIGSLFTGLMDEIHISSVARYEQDFTPQARLEPDAHTLALFRCDEGSGVVLRDSSGNDHHGQINGPASWHKVSAALIEWPKNLPPLAAIPFDAEAAKQHQTAWAKHLNMPEEVENSIGMKLQLIPPGEFLMGAPDDDADAQPAEKPQHKVRLTKPFLIGITEVTVGQFRKFVDETKYVTQAESDGKGAFDIRPQQRNPANVWKTFSEADEQPVRCVSWEDAQRFCEWLGKQEGRTYRLPTDAEWEFACRAGTTTKYSFGNDFDETKANGTLPNQGAPIRPVAQYPANPFGLFDMHGNAHEICWDGGRSFSTEDVVDPVGPIEQSPTVVVRGGACSSPPARLRSSQRYVNDGRIAPERNFATPVKGFRVVALVVPPSF
ncbi:MAG: SUMF1/EgtB/PvdO family nonheme iron enzyme, partial [Planctomycetaceae bacterium]|nr:SUMF1/EgtB/PvdO family nonheme iron enzyme [Planctomycetaceae bacterium]